MDRFLKRPSSQISGEGDGNGKDAVECGPAKKKQMVKFREAYRQLWPFIKPSSRGQSYAFCVSCGVDISIGSGGQDDIKKHIKSTKHSQIVKASTISNSVSAYMNKESDLSVIRAEVLWTKFVVDRNLPVATSDHFRSLIKEMCPDSDIAKKFSCGRTKTSAIASCLAQDFREELVNRMRKKSFSLGTDGSNDHDSKLYPIVVTINNEVSEIVTTSLLSILELSGSSTAENISQLILRVLEKFDIPVANCLGFISDNANVMVGRKGGVSTLLKKANPDMVSLGCGCHLINLAAKKAVKALPLKVDELLVDVYYFFHHSDRRQAEFKDVQLLYNDDTKKVLKHCPTRWLCLSTSLQRLVDLWEPLSNLIKRTTEEAKQKKEKVEIKSQKSDSVIESWFPDKSATTHSNTPSSDSRLSRINDSLSSKRALAYCCFLLWIMPLFDKFNKLLQQDKPLIYNLRNIYLQMYRDLLTKFIRPDIIQKNTHDITHINIQDEINHIRNKDLYIGGKAQEQLLKLRPKCHNAFLSNIKQFYITALEYMTSHFPLKDQILQHASFTNIQNRHTASFSDIQFFFAKVPSLDCSIDELHNEFSNFQSADLPDEIIKEERIDKQWNQLSKYINPVDNSQPFKHLSHLALSILTIPHSNAASERIFSLVRKNRNETRSSMTTETLDSILVCKVASSSSSKFTPSSTLLRKCKRATVDSLHNKDH